MVEKVNIDIIRLSLKYQDYLTYLGIIWTVGISFLVGIISYIFTSWATLEQPLITFLILFLILIFIEIIFISLHFWINKKKQDIFDEIKVLY